MADNNKNVAYIDFFVAGQNHPFLTGLEQKSLDKHEQRRSLKANFHDNALHDLRSVLNVFANAESTESYIDYAHSLQAFRQQQSMIASYYKPNLIEAEELAIGNGAARALVDKSLNFAMGRIRRQEIGLESQYYAGNYAAAVAHNTSDIIGMFVHDLKNLAQSPGYRKPQYRSAIVSHFHTGLTKFVEQRTPENSLFQNYIIGTLHHILHRRSLETPAQKRARTFYVQPQPTDGHRIYKKPELAFKK